MWTMLLGLFAKPLGAAINNALAAGAGAATLWLSQKGVDASITAPIITGLVSVLSLSISALAATQGVTIPVINADQNNGARVVNAADARAAGLPKIDAPIPKT